MKRELEQPFPSALQQLCTSVRALVDAQQYEHCMSAICQAMEDYPHAPQPHNLMGIVLEKKGDHLSAMKHFRAAWALDPTYAPANHNLATYGTFFSSGGCAFDESDLPTACPEAQESTEDGQTDSKIRKQYEARGMHRVVRRTI